MANYDTLKATIDAYIRANGVKAITGPVLNGVLRAMVDSLGNGFLFAGEALPNGDPGTPDQNVVRYATQAGTYTNYGGYVHDGKHLVWFVWHGSWNAYPTQVPTDSSLPDRVSQLANDAGYITADALADFYTKVQTDALLAGKQDGLVSGENIKTINGESILGSGDITIQGGGSEPYFIRGTIDFNQNPPAVTITSGTYAEALAAYNAGTPVYAALTEGNGAVNIYPLAQVISPFLVFIGIGADSVLAVGLQSDGTVMVANSALVHPSDLAPVATSGDYNDLTNKPTIPGPEVFWAEYGVTTEAEIDAAISDNKLVAVMYAGRILIFSCIIGTTHYFSCTYGGQNIAGVRLLNGVWSNDGAVALQQIAQRVTSWGATPSDSKYPSEKLVYDSLGKMGVIRQTQTWTHAADGGYDYTMSNPVRGLIPQANIDLFESAGAVFNASTGYFELNGLTDISYNEMKAIYAETYMLCRDANLQARMRDDQCRTNIPFYGSGTYQSEYQMNGFCLNEPNLEVLMFQSSGTGCNASGLNYAFRKCPRLKRIAGQQKIGTTIEDVDFYLYVNSVTSTPNNAFIELPNLESVFINSLRGSISLADSPKLLPKCVAYMVSNASTATITITLHATAYARAMADPAVQAALAAHTNVTLASA